MGQRSRGLTRRPDTGLARRLLRAVFAAAPSLLTLLRRPGPSTASALVRRVWIQRHPLTPAAVRVERARSRTRRGAVAEQTAVTVWFGDGPQLPGPGATFGRAALRLGVGMISAAAVAAAGGAAARIAGAREVRVVPAAGSPRRLPAEHSSGLTTSEATSVD